MSITLHYLAAMAACTMFASAAVAQSARDIRGPSPLVAIENEPPPKLIVDPPLAEQLAKGLVFIQYGRRRCSWCRLRQGSARRLAAHRPSLHHRG